MPTSRRKSDRSKAAATKPDAKGKAKPKDKKAKPSDSSAPAVAVAPSSSVKGTAESKGMAAPSPRPFEGFADSNFKFFRALEKHQDRDWFTAHKAEYEEGWAAPMASLLAGVLAAVDSTFTHCDLAAPKVFRIYRDVRFAKDKSPYKTFVAGGITVLGKSLSPFVPSALYVQLGMHEGKPSCFAAAGQYGIAGPELARYRAAVLDDRRGKELVSLVTKLEKKGFTLGSESSLARPPQGVMADHPRVELLKRKGLIMNFGEVPRDTITSKAFQAWLVERTKLAAPLVEWVTYATS